MYIENASLVIPDEFIDPWATNKSAKQIVAESTSTLLETRRSADPYTFLFNDKNELISPDANCRVKDVIRTNNYIGKAEYQAVEKLEAWGARVKQGVAVWVSPIFPGIYPDLKIVVSELSEVSGRKQLFNRAIIFDLDQKESWKLVDGLATVSLNNKKLSSLEEARATPFILKSSDWISELERIIPDPKLWQDIRRGEDLRVHAQTFKQARQIYQEIVGKNQNQIDRAGVEAMLRRFQIDGMVGNFRLSCPKIFTQSSGFIGAKSQTAFQMFYDNAYAYFQPSKSFQTKEKWDYHPGDCRVCEEKGLEVGPCEICKECEKTFD